MHVYKIAHAHDAQADLEALDAAAAEDAAGKGKAKRPERAGELERLMAGHGGHIARLEQLLRLLENDQVGPVLAHASCWLRLLENDQVGPVLARACC
jgi:CCR4-NOT transcriptional regulation complex NOT5 subunit